MTFYDFIDNIDDFKEDKILEVFKVVMKTLESTVNHGAIAKMLLIGIGPFIEDMEDDDYFGTEGMQL